MSLPSWCPPYNSSRYDSVTGQEVFCLCKRPDNGELMVGCDGCDDWFHFSCVKVPDVYRKLVKSFFCPYCQAGLSGKFEGELRESVWKRKCRLPECYEPCMANSKYCSDDHGVKYMQDLVYRVKLGDMSEEGQKEFLQNVVQVCNDNEKLEKFGESDFISRDVNPELSPDLYQKLIVDDTRLSQLIKKRQDVEDVTMPQLKRRIEAVHNHLQWLKEINNQLAEKEATTATNDTSSTTKKKSKGKKSNAPAKRICGYTSNIDQSPDQAAFLESYDEEQSSNLGICTKKRCVKHNDWSNIQLDRSNLDLMNLQTYTHRLDVLIKIRKEQLNIQFYQLLTK